MTLANWFTPRRRRAALTPSEPPRVPEPRQSPERAGEPLCAPRGREFWLVANNDGDVWDFDTESQAESWAHGRAAVDRELVVWRTWAEAL